MQPSSVLVFAAALLPAATAMRQQRVLATPTSVFEGALDSTASASYPTMVNSTDSVAEVASKRLTTAAAEKQALEASVMGLVVFSAAGLFLL
ncbi:hypothetical protein F4779DRAFT_304232 [Xylariaceae sp. FL0662B]|nr:hypothetical protein F4779DRAFT_304232 [Xylariaceae sp. FL0662B]